jgi:hypothetical protein
VAGGLLIDLLSLDLSAQETDFDSPDLLEQSATLLATRGLDGSGQTVAVIDSGVAYDHVALGGGFGPGYRVVGGWDFAENDADPYDDGPAGYHGSHVAALLAGQTDNFRGIAPGADIVALRVFDDQGAGQLEWIESSLQWVIENQDSFAAPITTVNLSVGAALSDANRGDAMAMLEDELATLREHNILVFAATGNLYGTLPEHNAQILYPASSPSVVPVASLDADGNLSDFAQRQAGVLAARGEAIRSAVPDHVFGWDGKVDDFAQLSGTSMATPQVAATSMLIRQSLIQAGLEPTADEILARLETSSTTRHDVSGIDYKTVDLFAAIGDSEMRREYAGGTGSDRVELDLRDGIVLRVDGESFSLDPADGDQPLRINVGDGDDSLHIIGSPQAERLTAYPPTQGHSVLATNSFEIELVGFETITFDGGGGLDRATLFDSPTSDNLVSRPQHTTLSGTGFQFDVIGVSRVYVHGIHGGTDTAFLYDGSGDDTLEVRPQFTSLSGSDAFQLAYGFERVHAYASAGGHDSAALYDSAADDTMSISPGRSMIAGIGYQISARGFESAVGYATSGGYDIARIYADDSNSLWHATADMVQWTGADDTVRIARGFEQVEAFENYQPIQLATQTQRSPFAAWWLDDAKQRAIREADAARQVFADLGR